MAPEDHEFFKQQGIDMQYKSDSLLISNLDEWMVFILSNNNVSDIEQAFGTWFIKNHGCFDIVSPNKADKTDGFVGCLAFKDGTFTFKAVFMAYKTIDYFKLMIDEVWYRNDETQDEQLIKQYSIACHINIDDFYQESTKAFDNGIIDLKSQILGLVGVDNSAK